MSAYAPQRQPVSVPRLLRLAGYRDIERVRPSLRRAAEEAAGLAFERALPAASYRRGRIAKCTDEGLVLDGGGAFRAAVFAELLAGCREVGVFVLSIGPAFDAAQADLAREDRGLEAYLMELAGWLSIESATRQFRDHLGREAAVDELQLSHRLAPGYWFRLADRKAEWPLEDQRALFSLLDGEALPARLIDESCAMTPKMSRSGLYGLRPARAPLAGARH